jgi:hypothetical protein
MSTHEGQTTQASAPATESGERKVIAEIGIRLLDDAHMAWQQAELECEQALSAWCDGPPGRAADRYLRYQAALDREDAAARDLERLWDVAQWGHRVLTATGPQQIDVSGADGAGS